MSRLDQISPWFFGESSCEEIEARLSNENNGTFTVFKPDNDSDSQAAKFILAFKDYDTIVFKEILYNDDLYGFVEPLQFDSLAAAIDTFNGNTHSRYGGSLRNPLKKTEIHCESDADLSMVLKQIRNTDRLRIETDEHFSAIKDKIMHLDEEIYKLTKASDAIGCVLTTLQKQIERHKSLEEGFPSDNRSEKDITDFSENLLKLKKRIEQETEKRMRAEEQKAVLEEKKNKELIEKIKFRVEVERLQSELETNVRKVLEVNPNLEEFIDGILAESKRLPITIKPVKMSKSEAKKKLKDCVEGTYLVWSNSDKKKPYAISVKFPEWVGTFYIIYRDGFYGFNESTCIFEDLNELMMNCGKIPFRFLDKQCGDVTLTQPLAL